MEEKMGWAPGSGLGQLGRHGDPFPLPSRYFNQTTGIGYGSNVE